MTMQFIDHVIHSAAAIARSLANIICTCLMTMASMLRLVGINLLGLQHTTNPRWWCLLLVWLRELFGIGYLSESVGYFLLCWGSLQYDDLPCCTQFYLNPSNAGKSHHCSSIRVIEVISADKKTGVQCRLTTLEEFSKSDEKGKGRYNCLSYTWGEPLTPFGLDVYRGWRARWEREFRERTAVIVFIFESLLGGPLRFVTSSAQMILSAFPGAVGRFLSREYWKRKWIFQEVVAARHLTVACGRWKLQWDETCMVSRGWHHFGSRFLAGVSIPGRQEIGVLPPPHLVDVWRDAYREGKEDRLRSKFGKFILQDHRGRFLCQLGHDVLYALVGVCNYPEDRLQVNYKKPVSQVYTELWEKILNTGVAGLSFLCCVEDKSRRKHRGVTETWQKQDPDSGEWEPWAELSLPSWAPDFAVELQPTSLADYYTQETFAAAGKMQFDRNLIRLKISMPENWLSVKGFLVDTIGTIISETGEEFATNFKVPRWLDLVFTHIKTPQSPYNSHAARIEALWRSMSVHTDAPKTSWEPQSDTASLCHGWLLDLFSKGIMQYPRNRVELHWPEILRLTITVNPADPIHEKDIHGPLNRIHHALGHRKLDKALRRWIPTVKEVKRYSKANWKLSERRGSARRNGRQSRLLKTLATRGYVGTQAAAFGGRCLHNRRLFFTERGYVGKGPKSLQPGDQIWIFAGCPVPLILRKSRIYQKGHGTGPEHKVQDGTETYELVGHAYVDGIMHGEAVNAKAPADAQEVTMI